MLLLWNPGSASRVPWNLVWNSVEVVRVWPMSQGVRWSLPCSYSAAGFKHRGTNPFILHFKGLWRPLALRWFSRAFSLIQTPWNWSASSPPSSSSVNWLQDRRALANERSQSWAWGYLPTLRNRQFSKVCPHLPSGQAGAVPPFFPSWGRDDFPAPFPCCQNHWGNRVAPHGFL